MIAFDPTINTINVDMDGVLADFDAFVLQHMGRTFDHQAGPSDQSMWDFLKTVEDMYYILPPTPYAKELWDFVNSIGCKVQVLTAIPRRTSMPQAEEQKRRWFVKHRDIFGDNVTVVIGPYSADKWKHAKPGDILIDDRTDNISAWVTKGSGIGVYHRHIKDTIALVKSCL
jgi:5'(3')-deoxyribonucleotidase